MKDRLKEIEKEKEEINKIYWNIYDQYSIRKKEI